MPTPTEVAEAHYAAQARQAEAAAVMARRLWRQMDSEDLERSWARIVRRLTLSVGAAQLGAARAGAAYVPLVLAAAGSDPDADGDLNPSAWAGVASDGRPLDSLLFSSVVRVREGFGSGLLPRDALESGGKWLDALTRTQVADAGRGAAGAAIAVRPRVGYVRFVSPPCCQRCAVLAGKFFRYSAGFRRHPGCDCRHVAQSEDQPSGYKAEIGPDEIKDLTEAQRKAISDGADLNKVINSHRANARGKSGLYTAEGTGRGKKRGTRRLTPEGCYRLSGGNRDKAVALLKQYGYVI